MNHGEPQISCFIVIKLALSFWTVKHNLTTHAVAGKPILAGGGLVTLAIGDHQPKDGNKSM
jgi:hypothetical protein